MSGEMSFTEKELIRVLRDLREMERATLASASRLREMAKATRERLDKHVMRMAHERLVP